MKQIIKPLLPKDLIHFFGDDSKHDISCYLTTMINNLANGSLSISEFVEQFRAEKMTAVIARHFHLKDEEVIDYTNDTPEEYGLKLSHKGKPIMIEWCEGFSDTVRDVGEDSFKCELIDGKKYYWRWL